MTGTGWCAVVEGLPGIGKSWLLDAVADQAADLGFQVASGRAAQLDRAAAPLTTLLTTLRHVETGIQPALDISVFDSKHLGFMETLRARLAGYSTDRPLLVTIDDAHLADDFTAYTLRSLIPELSSERVAWVLTRRRTLYGGPAQEVLDELLTNGALRYELGPLDDNAVREVCTSVLGAEPTSDVLDFAKRSQGDPALLIDVLTGLRDSDAVQVTDGFARFRTDCVPKESLSSVEKRLRSLLAMTRQLLDAASVVGRPFTLHEVAELVNLPATALMPSVYEALEAGLLVESGSALMFRHSLVRDAVHDRIPGPVRAALHREAVPVQLAEHRDPSEIAAHMLAGDLPSDKLVSRLTGLLADSGDRPELRAGIVRTLIDSHRLAEAGLVIAHPASTVAEQDTQAELLLELAELVTFLGMDIGVRTLTHRLLAENRRQDRTQARLLAASAHGLLHNRRLAEADRVAFESISLAMRVNDSRAQSMGLLCRSVIAWSRGDVGDATALARQAAGALGTDPGRHVPALWLARMLIVGDCFDEAETTLTAARPTPGNRYPAWSVSAWHAGKALLHLVVGRLNDAAADASTAVALAGRPGPLQVRPFSLLAYVSILRDDLAAARRYLHNAQEVAVEGTSDAREAAWRRATLFDCEGRPEEALASFEEVCDRVLSGPFYVPEEPQAAATMVRIAQRAGARDKAEVVVEAIRTMSRNNPGPASISGAAKHAAGLFRGDITMLHAAAAAYSSSGRPISSAAALEDAGYAEHAAAHPARAATSLRKAHDHYVQAGAERESTRVHTALGTPPQARSRRMHTAAGWHSLTESEMRVATLVAEGLSNRQVAERLFLSPHTVDSHLRRSFAKLGVSNRVQLTRTVMPILTGHPEKT